MHSHDLKLPGAMAMSCCALLAAASSSRPEGVHCKLAFLGAHCLSVHRAPLQAASSELDRCHFLLKEPAARCPGFPGLQPCPMAIEMRRTHLMKIGMSVTGAPTKGKARLLGKIRLLDCISFVVAATVLHISNLDVFFSYFCL